MQNVTSTRYAMDRQDFERVVPELRLKLQRIALYYLADDDEAEDVVQDTLLKLWTARDAIREGQGGMEALGTTIAKNLSIDRLRTVQRHRHDALTDTLVHGNGSNAQTRLEQQEDEDWIKATIRNLPDKYRAVLQMRQVENMEFAEIARIIGTSETAARVILSRARSKVMEQLRQRRT